MQKTNVSNRPFVTEQLCPLLAHSVLRQPGHLALLGEGVPGFVPSVLWTLCALVLPTLFAGVWMLVIPEFPWKLRLTQRQFCADSLFRKALESVA